MTTTYSGQKFATETLVTDTVAYDVMGSTAKTIKIRARRQTGNSRRDPNADQGPYPVVLTETESNPAAEILTLRLRKDGTFRRGTNPLRFKDTPPEVRTDYRF